MPVVTDAAWAVRAEICTHGVSLYRTCEECSPEDEAALLKAAQTQVEALVKKRHVKTEKADGCAEQWAV